MKQNVKHRMQIIERGFGFTDKVRRKYMIPLNAVPNSSVLLEVVYFEGILLSCSLFFSFIFKFELYCLMFYAALEHRRKETDRYM